RDVGDDELAIVEACDAEIRRECREGVVRDLRTRARERSEKRGLPCVRQTREADVGQQLELEIDLATFALAAVFGDARCAPGARRETRVSLPAGAAARHDELLTRGYQIGHRLARRAI